MIKLEKIDNGVFPDINVSDGTNSFMIARNNLPDTCWFPDINDFIYNDDITFTIKEEDENVYLLFNKLYQDIIDGNVFPLTESDIKDKSPEEVKKMKKEKVKERAYFRNDAQRSGLVNNGVISLHSEDYDAYDFASILTIKKVDKQIEVTFTKNKENPDRGYMRTPPTYLVRITESGGIYGSFFVLFADFRRQLQTLLKEQDKVLIKKI